MKPKFFHPIWLLAVMPDICFYPEQLSGKSWCILRCPGLAVQFALYCAGFCFAALSFLKFRTHGMPNAVNFYARQHGITLWSEQTVEDTLVELAIESTHNELQFARNCLTEPQPANFRIILSNATRAGYCILEHERRW